MVSYESSYKNIALDSNLAQSVRDNNEDLPDDEKTSRNTSYATSAESEREWSPTMNISKEKDNMIVVQQQVGDTEQAKSIFISVDRE